MYLYPCVPYSRRTAGVLSAVAEGLLLQGDPMTRRTEGSGGMARFLKDALQKLARSVPKPALANTFPRAIIRVHRR